MLFPKAQEEQGEVIRPGQLSRALPKRFPHRFFVF